MREHRIVVGPEVHLGKPCVSGTRISVESVLELVSAGIHFETISQEHHPELDVEDVRACVEYALDLVRKRDRRRMVRERPFRIELPEEVGIVLEAALARWSDDEGLPSQISLDRAGRLAFLELSGALERTATHLFDPAYEAVVESARKRLIERSGDPGST